MKVFKNDRYSYHQRIPSFGAWICQRRKEEGITLNTLSEKTGVSSTKIWMIENEEKVAKTDVIDKLLPVLGYRKEVENE